MPQNNYDAIKLLAQAQVENSQRRYKRAVELLTQIINLSESETAISEYVRRITYIELYKAHKALGHDKEALTIFNKAIKFGVKIKELETNDDRH